MRIVRYIVLCLAISFFSCGNDSARQGGDVFNLSHKIQVDLTNGFIDQISVPALLLTTIDTFVCKNVIIDLDVNDQDNRIDIDMQGVALDKPCISGEGNAVGQVNVHLNASNVKEVHFLLDNDQVIKGKLIIDPSSFRFELIDQDFLKLGRTTVHRLEPNTVFGYISPFSATTNLSFGSSILSEFDESSFTPPVGDYGLFFVSDNGDVSVSHKDGEKVGFYKKINDLEAFKTAVANWRTSHPNLEVVVTTSSGESI